MPSAAEFGYDARTGTYLQTYPTTVNYHDWLLSLMRPYFGSRVLEVGGGIGKITPLLSARTTGDLYTLEPSPEMFPLLEERAKQIGNVAGVFSGTLQDNQATLAKLELDTAVYINVLEHIEDDAGELEDAAKLLVPGGHVCTFSPAFPALYSPRDHRVGHVRRYYLREKVAKMKAAGLEPVVAQYFDCAGGVLWWGKFVLLRSDQIGAGSVGFFDNVVVPLQRRVEPKWLPFGKNVLVIGRKPA